MGNNGGRGREEKGTTGALLQDCRLNRQTTTQTAEVSQTIFPTPSSFKISPANLLGTLPLGTEC